MPFPKIKYCLVCDNAREETRGKITLIGFLGVSPEVDILIPDPPSGGAVQLAFVLIGGKGDGQHRVAYEIFDCQKGAPLAHIDPGQPLTISPGTRTNMIINVLGGFPHFGAYEFRVLLNGQVNFSAPFNIIKAP